MVRAPALYLAIWRTGGGVGGAAAVGSLREATQSRLASRHHPHELALCGGAAGDTAYAWSQVWVYPVESGNVERANDMVVARRMAGTGRHWARAHVNPLVALRTIACNDWWEEAWLPIARQVRHHHWQS